MSTTTSDTWRMTNSRRFYSIRTLLVAAFILAVLLPALVINFFVFIRGQQDDLTRSVDQLETTILLKESEINSWLDDLQRELSTVLPDYSDHQQVSVLVSVSSTETMKETSGNWLRQVFADTLKQELSFETLFLLNMSGKVVLSSETDEIDIVYDFLPYLQAAVEDPSETPFPHVLEPETGSILTFQPIFTHGLMQATQRQVAFLVGRADLAPLYEILSNRVGLGDTGEIYLLNLDYTVATPLRNLPEFREAELSAEYVEAIDASTSDNFLGYTNYHGVVVAGSYRHLTNLDAVLLAEKAYSEILQSTTHTVILNVVVTAIAVLGVIVGGLWFVKQKIASPLTKLTRVTRQVAGGNLSLTTDIDEANEFGLLAQSFDHMTAQLNQTVIELEYNEARFRSIIESVPIGMHIYQISDSGRLVFIEANPAAADIFDVATEEEKGRPVLEAFPIFAETELPSRFYDAAANGTVWQTEEMILGGRGYAIYAFQTSPDHMVVAFLDVSERIQAEAERGRLQQEIIEAQRAAIRELSTPIIPVVRDVIVLPLVGSIDAERAREITRGLLEGITRYNARVVIIDITGVSIIDSEVANHLNKTFKAARLKGSYTIITGISDEVAETIVDLGIDWSKLETLRDLQSGLLSALRWLKISVKGL